MEKLEEREQKNEKTFWQKVELILVLLGFFVLAQTKFGLNLALLYKSFFTVSKPEAFVPIIKPE